MHCRLSSHIVCKTAVLFLMLVLGGLPAKSQGNTPPKTDSSSNTFFGQSESYSYTAADNEFTMILYREKAEVVISIIFKDSLVFDYISIERQPNFSQTFTQCKYVSYDETKSQGRHIIVKDNYPFAASTDVSYRLKITSKDGATRTYPPLELPAVNK